MKVVLRLISMDSKKILLNCLYHARLSIDRALKYTEEGNTKGSFASIHKAIHYLKMADNLIIKRHVSECVPILFKKSTEQAVNELVRIYRYRSS